MTDMNIFALTRKCPAERAQITCFFLVYGKIFKFIFVIMTVVWASAHGLVAGEDTRYGLGSWHCICTGKMARVGGEGDTMFPLFLAMVA